MLVSEFINKVNYSLRGLDDDAPTANSDEWNYWLDLFNQKKNELFLDVSKRLSSSFLLQAPAEKGTVATSGTTTLTGTDTFFTDYAVGDKITVSGETERTIATIVSDTSLTVTVAFSNTASAKTFTRKTIIKSGSYEYSLHRAFLGASDTALVIDTNSDNQYFNYQQPAERDIYSRYVYITGQNPQKLSFTNEIEATESLVGGELRIPGYYLPDDVTSETDILPVPSPDWAVAAVSAEIAFGDVTYEDKAETLNSKANYLYKAMLQNNRRGTFKNPRVTPISVKRIRDTRR